ncbi:MAG: DUF3467 domain-containing protein [Thermoanaerobaculia bacterium]
MAESESEFVDVQFPNFYTNNVTIGSNAIDFAFLLTERVDAEHSIIKARVVMTPTHAKMLLNTLRDHIERWENAYWPIQLPPKKPTSSASSDSEPQP